MLRESFDGTQNESGARALMNNRIGMKYTFAMQCSNPLAANAAIGGTIVTRRSIVVRARSGRQAPSPRVRFGEEGQVLRQHVACLEIWHDKNLRASGDFALDSLDPRGFRIDCVIESQRAVENAAGDLTALGHLAQRCCLDGRGNFGGDRLHGR